MRDHFTQKAFTLIELLVVIAIISIIAAILFPVFARVREKARQTSCASNIRQVSLGIIQYIQDNDEVVPPVEYTLDDANYPDDAFTWVRLVQPYVKTYSVFRCPDAEVDNANAWKNGRPYSQQYSPSYGYNYSYLNPLDPCSSLLNDGNGFGILAGPPINIARIQEPSNTVLITDTKLYGDSTATWMSSDFVDSPTMMRPTSACFPGTPGWGLGSIGDSGYAEYPVDPGTAPAPITSTGNFSIRHNGGGNVAFCDGHVKWMLPSALAAGTNWHPGINYTDVKITDLSKYLWSLSKSGGTDL